MSLKISITSSPAVSVVIPVYNYEKYIKASIQSVLAQSYTDWELIIVDDHSTDTTPEIASSFEDGKRIRLVANDQNLGQFATHNRGAALAKGKYIKFFHGDDIMYPHCLEMMVTLMEAFPTAGLGISHNPWPWVAPKLFSPLEAWRLHVSGQNSMMSEGPSGTIFRTEAFRSIGGFDTRFHSSDVKMSLSVAMEFPVLLMPHGLWWYRHHEKQTLMFMLAHDIGLKESLVWFTELLKDSMNPLPIRERKIAEQIAIKELIMVIVGHTKRGNFSQALKFFRLSGISVTKCLKTFKMISGSNRIKIQKITFPNWSFFPYPPRVSTNLVHKSYTGIPKVSVLIPACEAQLFIKDAIESVKAQRFEDWELIILDDASTDNTYEIAKFYSDCNRIRCFRNKERLGKWGNHNRVAELARGKYFKFLHADELLYPHCLEQMVHAMERYPEAGMGVSGGGGYYFAGVCLDPLSIYRQEFLGHALLRHVVTRLIFRAEAFQEIGGFNESYFPAEYHINLRIGAKYPLILICEGLTWHPRYTGILSDFSQKYTFDALESIGWIREFINGAECPLPEEERLSAYQNFIMGYTRRVKTLMKQCKILPGLKRLREANLRLLDLRHSNRPKKLAPDEFWKHVKELTLMPDWTTYPNARSYFTEETRNGTLSR